MPVATQVTPVDVMEVVLPHLQSGCTDVTAAAVRATEAVAGVPMLPKVRQELHTRLLAFLGGPGRAMRPSLARARLTRAVIETAGLTALKMSPQACSALQVRLRRQPCIAPARALV